MLLPSKSKITNIKKKLWNKTASYSKYLSALVISSFLYLSLQVNASEFDIYDENDVLKGTIWGTVHTYPCDHHPSLGSLVESIVNCEIAYKEHSNDFIGNVLQILRQETLSHVNKAPWIDTEFNEAQRNIIISRLKQKITLPTDDHYKKFLLNIFPWQAAILLEGTHLSPIDRERFMNKVSNGIDAFIEHGLIDSNKTIRVLETPESYVEATKQELMNNMRALDFIKKYIDGVWTPEDELPFPFGKSKQEWEVFIKNREQITSFMVSEETTKIRNHLWAEVLISELRKNNGLSLIFIGIKHLYGEENLRQILKKHGFKIKVKTV